MGQPFVKRLASGWLHVWWTPQAWAQLPPGFCAAVIPDEYVFNPGWCRDRVNRWWQSPQGQEAGR